MNNLQETLFLLIVKVNEKYVVILTKVTEFQKVDGDSENVFEIL